MCGKTSSYVHQCGDGFLSIAQHDLRVEEISFHAGRKNVLSRWPNKRVFCLCGSSRTNVKWTFSSSEPSVVITWCSFKLKDLQRWTHSDPVLCDQNKFLLLLTATVKYMYVCPSKSVWVCISVLSSPYFSKNSINLLFLELVMTQKEKPELQTNHNS